MADEQQEKPKQKRRVFLQRALGRADAFRGSMEELTTSRALKLLYGYLDEDTRDQTTYLDEEVTVEWAQDIVGKVLYCIQGVDEDETDERAKEPPQEDRRSSQALKNIGVTTQDTKVRVRLPKVLRKKGAVTVKARNGDRSWVSARVGRDLIQKARERGNISQCVEEGLKLLFAE